VEAIRRGARIMFGAGARRMFFASVQPLILESADEIDGGSPPICSTP
jgi:hypothetical protein